MEVRIPESVVVIELDNAPFRNAHEAKLWACLHGIPGKMSDEDTRGKGEISISLSSLEKMLSGQALRKSVTPAIHYAALVRLRDIIRESFVAEIHPDFRKYEISNIEVLTGTARIVILPNVKTSIDPRVLKGIAAPVALPSDKTSIDVSILLNGVCDVNGAPLLAVRK